MKKILKFFIKLKNKALENELINIGNELTYKLLLSIFPLIICIISIINLINIDINRLNFTAISTIPDEVLNIIENILAGISTNAPNAQNTIIYSLLFAIISASSGFTSIIRGINKTYSIVDKRNYIFRKTLSVILVLIFLLSIVFSLVILIFGDVIISLILRFGFMETGNGLIYSICTNIFAAIFLLFNISIIYKLSCYKKISFLSTLPGAFITLIFWFISSKLFNIYINNFSRYNTIYGSIGSLIIFILWLNILSIVLLAGSQINAILYEDK